jgi:hypothetical protein
MSFKNKINFITLVVTYVQVSMNADVCSAFRDFQNITKGYVFWIAACQLQINS